MERKDVFQVQRVARDIHQKLQSTCNQSHGFCNTDTNTFTMISQPFKVLTTKVLSPERQGDKMSLVEVWDSDGCGHMTTLDVTSFSSENASQFVKSFL